MIHKILSGISVGTGFTAVIGIAGCIDTDALTADVFVSAAVLALICAITGYLGYIESGMRRKKNSPR